MKKLGKLKLNHLSENVLNEKQLNALKGACGCTCGNCGCSSWGGSGSLPVGQHQNDSGSGSMSTNLSGTLAQGI